MCTFLGRSIPLVLFNIRLRRWLQKWVLPWISTVSSWIPLKSPEGVNDYWKWKVQDTRRNMLIYYWLSLRIMESSLDYLSNYNWADIILANWRRRSWIYLDPWIRSVFIFWFEISQSSLRYEIQAISFRRFEIPNTF